MATSTLPAQNYGEPASEAVVVTPAATDLPKGTTMPYPRALYIGVTGDVKVDMADTGTAIVFTAVPVGILPVRVKRVYAIGTTASSIVALY